MPSSPPPDPVAHAGELDVDDSVLAAQEFNWLVLSIPLNHAMFRPDQRYSRDELHGYADAGVRTFLAAYGSRRTSPTERE